MLGLPEIRLQLAYRDYQKSNQPDLSFREFYHKENQQNVYANLLAPLDIEQLGFVGLLEKMIPSMFLAEDWTGLKANRQNYDVLLGQNKVAPLSPEDRDEIRRLNSDDYDIYQKVETRQAAQWQALLARKKIHLENGKKVIIHVGPPKTGTSAIQYWLAKNHKALLNQGVFYPGHQLDDNKISSGNFQRLIHHDAANKQSYLDEARARELVDEFTQSKAHTLLLSSEHFFYHMPALFMYFPMATFVFYVRHPFSTLESSYHQQVKRHGRTSAFNLPKTAKFQQLEIIGRLAKTFSVNVCFRYYDEQLFNGGTLVNDFRDVISVDADLVDERKRVNSKYALDALGFMRWCNGFASADVLAELDRWLQAYSEDKEPRSLITPEQRVALTSVMRAHAQKMHQLLPGLNIESLYQMLENYTNNSASYDASVGCDFTGLVKALKKQNILLAKRIYCQAQDNKESMPSSAAQQFTFSTGDEMRCTVQSYICKLQYQIKRLFS